MISLPAAPGDLVGAAPVSWATVQAYGTEHGFGFLAEHQGREGWVRAHVDPRALRDMYGVFREAPLHKEARFDALLERHRVAIEADRFPCADDIRSMWPNKPAIVVERDPKTGEMYVADGEKRVLNACFNGETAIDAFVIELDQGRGSVELRLQLD